MCVCDCVTFLGYVERERPPSSSATPPPSVIAAVVVIAIDKAVCRYGDGTGR